MKSKASTLLYICTYLISLEGLQDIVGNSDKTIFDKDDVYECKVKKQENYPSYFYCQMNDGR